MERKENIKELVSQMMKEQEIDGLADLQEVLKEMLKSGVEELLSAELEDELGYKKYERKTKKNSRNGSSKKTVRSDYGNLELDIPRDRLGEFEPKAVPKHSKDISAIEDKVISMYAKGMSQRDISAHIEDMYGIPLSASLVSKMTDKIIPLVEQWQNRALEERYPFIFMNAIHYKVKHDNRIVKKAAYVVLGINLEGFKDILGIWIGENESSKFWLKILTDLRNRGVKKVDIFSVDGLTGFKEAILASYPDSIIQRCVIHQIRSSTKYVSYKDIKPLMKDLKAVYKAPNEEEAYRTLELFKEQWNHHYPTCVKSWYENWDVISPFFKYSENIRKIMYTTNIIENLHRKFRKITKGKAVFSTDMALAKILYLVSQDAVSKWNRRVKNWDLIRNELSILHDSPLTT